jgi:hypothetical protein
MAGAVFCRTCGEKMNFDNLRPEDFRPPPGKRKGMGSAITRVLGLILLLVLVLVPGLCLVPISGNHDTESAEKTSRDELERRLRLLLKVNRVQELTFSEEELTALANPLLGFKNKPAKAQQADKDDKPEPKQDAKQPVSKPEETKKPAKKKKLVPVQPLSLRIVLLPDSTLKAIFKNRIYGKVNVYTSLKAQIEIPEKGDAQFNIKAVAVGKLPLFGILREKGLSHLCDIPKNRKILDAMLPRIGKFQSEDGSVTITTTFPGAPETPIPVK